MPPTTASPTEEPVLLGTRTVNEGGTLLVVPELKEPTMLPAFFNPKGKLVRDVSIVCYSAYSELSERKAFSFADALSGIGARGIRVAKEVPNSSIVCVNDINPTAIKWAIRSAEINGVSEKCIFSTSETCAFLDSREHLKGERFDVVDIDPFGTPSPFVDCAIRSVRNGGLLSVAATDSAVLCGVYPKVAQRKYGGVSLRTDYSQEIGLRLIYGLLASTAMRMETGVEPMYCHHDMHYFRVYCKVNVGNRFSVDNEKNMGFVSHCFNCGFRKVLHLDDLLDSSSSSKKKLRSKASAVAVGDSLEEKRKGANPSDCPNCGLGKRIRLGGPFWIGRIQSKEFVSKCKNISGARNDLLFDPEELDIPLYYDLTSLSQDMKIRTPKIGDVLSRLQASGHRASRTHLNPQAIRSEAPLREIRSVVKELAL